MRLLLIATLVSLTLFAATTTTAKTRDGLTPATEGTCDDLRGSGKLYGLCVAYCQAQDLHDLDLNDLRSVKKSSASRAILASYDKQKRSGDPDMPCLGGSSGGTGDPTDPGTPPDDPVPVSGCACWSGGEMSSFNGDVAAMPGFEGLPTYMACVANFDGTGFKYRNQVTEGYKSFVPISARVAYAVNTTAMSQAERESRGLIAYDGCVYTDSLTGAQRSFELTSAEASMCMQEISSQCDLYGNPQ